MKKKELKDTNIYIKQGRRYKPVGIYFHDNYHLTEGDSGHPEGRKHKAEGKVQGA